MPLIDPSEYSTYGFQTGTATTLQAQIAVDITENMLEIGLNTALITGTFTDRLTWPGYSWYRGVRPLH